MPIDFSQMPVPDVIETLEFEIVLQRNVAEFQRLLPDYQLLESDPYMILIESFSYREMLLRHRINSAASAMLLTKAVGADLEHIAVTYYRIERLLIDAGDANAVPPVPARYESDGRLRERCRLSLYANNTAGSKGAYQFHAMAADANIKGVHVAKHTPQAGDVTLTILSHLGDGAPTQAMLDAVQNALDDEATRPLNDTPIVQAASVVKYTLDATLICYPDANTAVAMQQANANALTYIADHHKLGYDITLAAIHAALMATGVSDVVIHTPANNIVIADNEAAHNIAIAINLGAANA